MGINGEYGVSEHGNFSIKDTIGIPHPYCITPMHLKHSEGMYLDIPRAESRGAVCDICKKAVNKGKQDKILTFDEHEQALLVECKAPIDPMPSELHDWLLSIKDEAEKNGYAGFAFLKSEVKK